MAVVIAEAVVARADVKRAAFDLVGEWFAEHSRAAKVGDVCRVERLSTRRLRLVIERPTEGLFDEGAA